MSTIYTEIDINAPLDKVWNTLTDFTAYGSWNPFIVEIQGEAKPDNRLTIKIKSKNKIQVFTPDIVALQAPSKLEWIGKIPYGAFKGHHCFDLSPTSEGQTKLIHQEHFSGWLKPLILLMIGSDTKQGFEAMNKSLKQQAESL